MIDENKNYFTITGKTLSKYNDRSRVAAQTSRLRDRKTGKQLPRKTKGHTNK